MVNNKRNFIEMKNILIPGAFRPVHGGHISMISKLLSDPDNNVYVLLSSRDRDGFGVLPTCDFLETLFGNYSNFHCLVSQDNSPVKMAYNMTAMKEFGDGIYAMAAADKDDDITRSIDYFSNFSPNGKYFTQGVKVIMLDPIRTPVYKDRDDEYNYTPISSRVIRNDIINDNYGDFETAYNIDGKRIVDEQTLKRYFNILKDCIEDKGPVLETAAGGHIKHVWEEDDMTFSDLKDLIHDIFWCRLDDVTEKIDGINLFSSIDNTGRVIFARNKSHMFTEPMTTENIENNSGWNDVTKESFRKGASTIKTVFSKLKDPIKRFNYNDGLDGLIYRTWISVEIVNNANMNVIPYPENFVSFHTKTMLTTCVRKKQKDDKTQYEIFTDPNIEPDSIAIEQAIEDANSDATEYRANVTPKIVMEESREFSNLFPKYMDDLHEIMDEYDLSETDTIAKYRYNAFRKYIVNNRPFGDYSQESLDIVARKWSGWEKPNAKKINKVLKDWFIYDKVKKFENKSLKTLQKRIMLPIDKMFINIGNDVIDHISGTMNDNNKNKSIEQIKKNITNAISAIEETGSEKDLEKLEYLLFRLGETTNVKASEGIVFKWRGKVLKLTGSFQVYNQVVNMSKKSLNR